MYIFSTQLPFSLNNQKRKRFEIRREKTGLEVRGTDATEANIKKEEGIKCIVTGEVATSYVYIARAY
jgi:hypothetical protein